MLKKLYIKNYALIDLLDIELYPGFSVLTGETGAGKSIILGAIGLLLGQRADSKSIKTGADRCTIEAHFDLSRYDLQPFFTDNDIDYDAEDTIIRREITATKSRAFINDTPVALSMLDFMQFQFEELTQAQLVSGEQEELEQQSDMLSHAEDIKGALYEADGHLNSEQQGAVDNVRQSYQTLRNISRVLPAASELAERLESCHIELKDIADEVSRLLERTDFDPAELDRLNNRLDLLYDLEKKYHVDSVDELIAQRDQLDKQLNAIENSDEAVAELEAKCQQLTVQCQQLADKLTAQRQKAAKAIEKQMQQRLVPLGMPHVRFEVTVNSQPLGRHGQDNVSFLFSANTSTPLQPVSQVASGGEIARVMLSLKAMISGAVKLPTIIFDEIDTGVSGKIAEKMAEMMREMGQAERQVISITHLPQIAAMGSHHYRVSKEETPQGTTSSMHLLNDDERIKEIAQMVSGSDVSEAAIANAKALLRQ